MDDGSVGKPGDLDRDPELFSGNGDFRFGDLAFDGDAVFRRDDADAERAGLADDLFGESLGIRAFADDPDHLAGSSFFHRQRNDCGVSGAVFHEAFDQVSDDFACHVVDVRFQDLDLIFGEQFRRSGGFKDGSPQNIRGLRFRFA